MNKLGTLPFYAKASIFILGLIGLLFVLYIAQQIIVPLVFAFIIAIVLQPVVHFMVSKKVNRVLAISLTLMLTIIILAAFSLLFYSQASRFGQSWPILVDKFTNLLNNSISSISHYLAIDPVLIRNWISKTKTELISGSSALIGQTLISLGNLVAVLFLVPVYVFIILFYQPLIQEFIHQLFSVSNRAKVNDIISQIKTLIQHYLVGLFIQFVLVAMLYSLSLFLLGIDYAILLGIIGALLNMIPYVGGIVGAALPMMVAFTTKDSSWYPVYIMLIYYCIQLIDNNIIVPRVVASKVQINALFSILAVFVGNALWGISGMFLSIPLLAILKLIFDHIEALKPWGYLLGNSMPIVLKKKNINN